MQVGLGGNEMILNDDVVVWRLQTRSGSGHIGQYCLDNNTIAMGWCQIGNRGEKTIGQSFEDYSEYVNWYEDEYGQGAVGDSVHRLVNDMKVNDLIWIRNGGKYYLGRVLGDWMFCSDEEAVDLDACNQRKVEWIEIGDESCVPGAINTSLIRGSALQRIWKPGVKEYSIKIYNHKKPRTYEDIELEFNCETFFNMLSNDDCEDLLYFYLYFKKHFICVPSSDKKGTAVYEYVMIDPQTGEHKYAQVKQQKDVLDPSANEYTDLDKEMWFFNGGSGGVSKNLRSNQHIVTPEELFEFAISDDACNIVSESIANWNSFLSGIDSDGVLLNDQECNEGYKGVMFDTLGEEYEKDMIKNHKISAYGRSSRYVKSAFRRDDYVFYYSKGKGIVAVGQITDNEPYTVDDEVYKKVRLIFPTENEVTVNPLTASEIKSLTGQNYYFASTIKSPYLNSEQSKVLIDKLIEKNR